VSHSSRLFTPFALSALQLPHRIVMAPMTRNRAGTGNVPTPLVAEHYAQRASAALIVTEATQISPQGVGYPGTPGLHSDEQVEGWRGVTRAVHQQGGRIFVQLWHVGRISHPSLQPNGALPVAPSPIAPQGNALTADGPQPFVTPRGLEEAEITEIVRQYARAAARARDAGFDGVEIHGANGYLIEQFLVDGSNRRSDRYGGSVANRARFLLEVTQAVSQAWDPARVGVRLSPRGTFNDISDSNRAATFGHAVDALGEFGLAYLHLVDPVVNGAADDSIPRLAPYLRRRFSGALIVNGGFTLERAAAAIEQDEADLVAFGVPFLSNPDLPVRLRLGAALNAPIRATFYGGDARGYTDYPTLEQVSAKAQSFESSTAST
jgi:N-ethylmaleimide reductase